MTLPNVGSPLLLIGLFGVPALSGAFVIGAIAGSSEQIR